MKVALRCIIDSSYVDGVLTKRPPRVFTWAAVAALVLDRGLAIDLVCYPQENSPHGRGFPKGPMH